MVSTELSSSWISDEPEYSGEADDASLGSNWACSISVGPSTFMVHKTEAASSNCTCWCLEMSSLEVIAHAGSCSHLASQHSIFSVRCASGSNIHMLCEAAAVLVALATGVAAKVS